MDDHGRQWKVLPVEDGMTDTCLAQEAFAEPLITCRLQAAADRCAALKYLTAEFTDHLGIRPDPMLLERTLPRIEDLAALYPVGPTVKAH